MKNTTSSNARSLMEAMATNTQDGSIPCRLITDGLHNGTLFAWVEGGWVVTDLENEKCLGSFGRLAIVSLETADADADAGLHQSAVGFDLDVGEWVVPAYELGSLQATYGKSLVVVWEQAEASN